LFVCLFVCLFVFLFCFFNYIWLAASLMSKGHRYVYTGHLLFFGPVDVVKNCLACISFHFTIELTTGTV